MNVRLAVTVTVTVAAAAAAAAVATGTSATARTLPRHRPSVSASVRPALAGQLGWQGEYTYSVPAGLGSLYFHDSCPSGLVASNGGFSDQGDPAGTIRLTTDSPRWDSNDNQWQWFFTWPGGAPSGETINFDVYCTNGPA